jgi:glycogen debranching enzyme
MYVVRHERFNVYMLTFYSISKDAIQTLHHLNRILLATRRHIQADPWAGLPELTNKEGQICSHSCHTQAWSAGTILDFLETAHKFSSI